MFVRSGKSNFSKPKRAKGLVLLLCMVFLLTVVNFTPVMAVDPVVDGKFTIAIIPDTQNEVTNSAAITGEWFKNRTQWLVNNKSTLDLRYVLATGDLANWPAHDADQMPIIATGLQVLGSAGIPYLPALGNHDTAATGVGGSAAPGDASVNVRNTTAFNSAVPLSRFPGIVTFESNKVENSYRTFEAEGKKWMVLSLELWPRTAAINWAKGVVQNHPDHNVIIQTHSYLNGDGSINQSNGGYGSNSPQYLYDNLVKVYPNIRFVFSGHVGAAAKREDTGVNGNKIVSILGCFHSTTTNP
ncbi:MAG: metallophosphoesterase, partial [Clostridia bacterium]|nr:metallophosphoesterase [Clostridia bacterium]